MKLASAVRLWTVLLALAEAALTASALLMDILSDRLIDIRLFGAVGDDLLELTDTCGDNLLVVVAPEPPLPPPSAAARLGFRRDATLPIDTVD